LQSLDLIEPRFRALYEAVAVGNKPEDAQWVFFEGLLLEEGLGMHEICPLHECSVVQSGSDLVYVGQNEAWYGKSSWGHPDYTRRSVCPITLYREGLGY